MSFAAASSRPRLAATALGRCIASTLVPPISIHNKTASRYATRSLSLSTHSCGAADTEADRPQDYQRFLRVSLGLPEIDEDNRSLGSFGHLTSSACRPGFLSRNS